MIPQQVYANQALSDTLRQDLTPGIITEESSSVSGGWRRAGISILGPPSLERMQTSRKRLATEWLANVSKDVLKIAQLKKKVVFFTQQLFNTHVAEHFTTPPFPLDFLQQASSNLIWFMYGSMFWTLDPFSNEKPLQCGIQPPTPPPPHHTTPGI